MAYKHTNNRGKDYYLHSKEVKLRGSGKLQKIYFFAPQVREKTNSQEPLNELPIGYKPIEVQRTGMIVLKKT